MRYLGLDYGTRRIGVAVSDERGEFAFPKESIPNDGSALDRLQVIVKRDEVGVIVIGDTRATNAAENPITKEAEEFSKSIAAHLRLPVHTVWEAWSSVEAARFAPKGKEHDDAAAAAIILQRYLSTKQGGSASV
jgi:putative Holliday junction resolvase